MAEINQSIKELQKVVLVDFQIAGDLYTHDQDDKLFMSVGDIDQDMAEDLHQF